MSNFWGSMKNLVSRRNLTPERQTSTEQHTPPPPQPERRQSVTTPAHVAHAINTGNVNEVRSIMGRHRIVTKGFEANVNKHVYAIKEQDTGEFRRIDSTHYSQIKTFGLHGLTQEEVATNTHPTIDASFVPMTSRESAWSNNDERGPQLQMQNVTSVQQHNTATITTPMTACTFARKEDNTVLHVPPYSKRPQTQDEAAQLQAQKEVSYDSTQRLRSQSTVAQTFGPKAYGKYPDSAEKRHLQTNILLLKDPIGDTHLLSQSIYGHQQDALRTSALGTTRGITSQSTLFGPQRERSSSFSHPQSGIQERATEKTRRGSVGMTPQSDTQLAPLGMHPANQFQGVNRSRTMSSGDVSMLRQNTATDVNQRRHSIDAPQANSHSGIANQFHPIDRTRSASTGGIHGIQPHSSRQHSNSFTGQSTGTTTYNTAPQVEARRHSSATPPTTQRANTHTTRGRSSSS